MQTPTARPFAHAKAQAGYLTVPISQLVENSAALAPIFDDRDDRNVLLLSAGTIITASVLDSIEFLEITKHPMYTFEMIKDVAELKTNSKMVAYQMHERCNGSGYPRCRRRNEITFLARIAAVADSFVAMISPRPHRPGLLPYFAIDELIRETRLGLFDPQAVRGLLQTVSLFPIGSYVEMNDDRVGKTVRANREDFTRPIVELWQPEKRDDPPEIVDLSQHAELSVTRPLAKLVPDGDSQDGWDDWQ